MWAIAGKFRNLLDSLILIIVAFLYEKKNARNEAEIIGLEILSTFW